MNNQDAFNYLGTSVIAFAVGYAYLRAYRHPGGNRVSRLIDRFTTAFHPRWWQPDLARQKMLVAAVCFVISALGIVLFALKALGLRYSWGPN
jgi:hypothetical protein